LDIFPCRFIAGVPLGLNIVPKESVGKKDENGLQRLSKYLPQSGATVGHYQLQKNFC